MMRTTQIVPQHVGYFWDFDIEAAHWVLRWEPVKGRYSPPVLDNTILSTHVDVPQDLQDKMGLVIGRDGQFFKYITHWSGAVYIFYRQDIGKIEIWGWEANLQRAAYLLNLHFNDVRCSYKP